MTTTELGATTLAEESITGEDTTDCLTMPSYSQQVPISWPHHTPAWAITPFRESLPANFGRRVS
jgi:hypothetical protein